MSLNKESRTELLTGLRSSTMIAPMESFRTLKLTFREYGLKGVVKKYGWKLFAVFFVYYLVRDLILYVLLPYLVYRGFTGHS